MADLAAGAPVAGPLSVARLVHVDVVDDRVLSDGLARTATVMAAAALRQGDRGAYVTLLGDEGEERVRAAYPAGTWDRLATMKRRYDPDDLFRLDQNIAPATEGKEIA